MCWRSRTSLTSFTLTSLVCGVKIKVLEYRLSNIRWLLIADLFFALDARLVFEGLAFAWKYLMRYNISYYIIWNNAIYSTWYYTIWWKRTYLRLPGSEQLSQRRSQTTSSASRTPAKWIASLEDLANLDNWSHDGQPTRNKYLKGN